MARLLQLALHPPIRWLRLLTLRLLSCEHRFTMPHSSTLAGFALVCSRSATLHYRPVLIIPHCLSLPYICSLFAALFTPAPHPVLVDSVYSLVRFATRWFDPVPDVFDPGESTCFLRQEPRKVDNLHVYRVFRRHFRLAGTLCMSQLGAVRAHAGT